MNKKKKNRKKDEEKCAKNKSKSLLKSVTIWITVIATMLGIFSGSSVFFTKIKLTTLFKVTKQYPYENYFVLSNDGTYFSIKHIECEVVDTSAKGNAKKPVMLYTHSPTGKLTEKETIKIDKLRVGQSTTFGLGKMFNLLVANPESAYFVISVSYKPSFFPVRQEKKFKFRLFYNTEGFHQWSETVD